MGESEGQAARPNVGEAWIFTALCPNTKLIVTWMIGPRDSTTAERMLVDLARRVLHQFRLTSDQANFYPETVSAASGPTIDYAQSRTASVGSEVDASSATRTTTQRP